MYSIKNVYVYCVLFSLNIERVVNILCSSNFHMLEKINQNMLKSKNSF